MNLSNYFPPRIGFIKPDMLVLQLPTDSIVYFPDGSYEKPRLEFLDKDIPAWLAEKAKAIKSPRKIKPNYWYLAFIYRLQPGEGYKVFITSNFGKWMPRKENKQISQIWGINNWLYIGCLWGGYSSRQESL